MLSLLFSGLSISLTLLDVFACSIVLDVLDALAPALWSLDFSLLSMSSLAQSVSLLSMFYTAPSDLTTLCTA